MIVSDGFLEIAKLLIQLSPLKQTLLMILGLGETLIKRVKGILAVFKFNLAHPYVVVNA